MIKDQDYIMINDNHRCEQLTKYHSENSCFVQNVKQTYQYTIAILMVVYVPLIFSIDYYLSNIVCRTKCDRCSYENVKYSIPRSNSSIHYINNLYFSLKFQDICFSIGCSLMNMTFSIPNSHTISLFYQIAI